MTVKEAIASLKACVAGVSKACQLGTTDSLIWVGVFIGVCLMHYAGRKVAKTLSTLPALALMPALSRQLSNWVRSRDYTEEEFLRADGACVLRENSQDGS